MDSVATQLGDILITAQLKSRPKRLADIRNELTTLCEINRCVSQRSGTLAPLLCQHAASICRAGSAGISILHRGANEEYFSWDIVVGQAAPFAGGRSPRHNSLCGICLKFKEPQLFQRPERYFDWMHTVTLPIVEALVVPLYLSNAKPLGTMWVLSHDEARKFDKEDVRILRELGGYIPAAMAFQEECSQQLLKNVSLGAMSD